MAVGLLPHFCKHQLDLFGGAPSAGGSGAPRVTSRSWRGRTGADLAGSADLHPRAREAGAGAHVGGGAGAAVHLPAPFGLERPVGGLPSGRP